VERGVIVIAASVDRYWPDVLASPDKDQRAGYKASVFDFPLHNCCPPALFG
jgi:hypothetical protein